VGGGAGDNIAVIETNPQLNGVYHVLHGTLSPLHGVGPGAPSHPIACLPGSPRVEVEESDPGD